MELINFWSFVVQVMDGWTSGSLGRWTCFLFVSLTNVDELPSWAFLIGLERAQAHYSFFFQVGQPILLLPIYVQRKLVGSWNLELEMLGAFIFILAIEIVLFL